jgi:hypothetical protein
VREREREKTKKDHMVRAIRKTARTLVKKTVEPKPIYLRMRKRLKMRWDDDVKHNSKLTKIYQLKNQA